jgi:hypothetical protein
MAPEDLYGRALGLSVLLLGVTYGRAQRGHYLGVVARKVEAGWEPAGRP